MSSTPTTTSMRTAGAGAPPPEYLSRKISARHSAFSARHPPSAQVRQRHDMLVQIVGEAGGASMNAMEINRRLGQRGIFLAMTPLYKDLKELTAQGRLHHEWLPRKGHLSSVYRLAEDLPAATVKLVCSACARAVDVPGAESLASVVADICARHDMPVSSEPLEIQVLCRSCELLRIEQPT